MDEPIISEMKKQIPQKPPLSAERFAGEILAGAVMGLAVALSVTYAIGGIYEFEDYGFRGFIWWLVFFIVFPPLYGLATAVGVCLVGNIGEQTGSFLTTSGCGFLLMHPYPFAMVFSMLTTGVVRLAGQVLLLLIPPIGATMCFNLTRRSQVQGAALVLNCSDLFDLGPIKELT